MKLKQTLSPLTLNEFCKPIFEKTQNNLAESETEYEEIMTIRADYDDADSIL